MIEEYTVCFLGVVNFWIMLSGDKVLEILRKLFFSTVGLKIFDSIFGIVIMYLIYKIICKIFKSVFNNKMVNSRFEKGHASTIEMLILSIIKYSFIILVVLFLIQNFVGTVGVTITGIIGVALGFASQNILKDILNGVLMTFENQFKVGDYVTINNNSSNALSGIVSSVQFRVTRLKDFNGDYHIIPNGFINEVTNHSRENSRILVDIQVDSMQKSDEVLKIIQGVLNEYSHEDLTEKPQFYGVVSSNEVSTTYRIIGYAKPLSHWKIENEIRIKLMDELLDENIILPVSRYSIVD